MNRPLLLLALKFLAITIPFTWFWLEWGRDAYFRFFVDSSRPVLIWLGITNFPPSMVRDRFLNYLPFVVLMLITPGLGWRRRVFGTLGGMVVLYLGHIGLTWAVFVTHVRDGVDRESMSRLFPALMLSDSLPFVLWAGIANQFLKERWQSWTSPEAGSKG